MVSFRNSFANLKESHLQLYKSECEMKIHSEKEKYFNKSLISVTVCH